MAEFVYFSRTEDAVEQTLNKAAAYVAPEAFEGGGECCTA